MSPTMSMRMQQRSPSRQPPDRLLLALPQGVLSCRCRIQIRSGVVPMGFTSSMGLLRMKSAQCLGIRLASVTASLLSSSAT